MKYLFGKVGFNNWRKRRECIKGFLKVGSEFIYKLVCSWLFFSSRKEEKMIKIKRDYLMNNEVIELVSFYF